MTPNDIRCSAFVCTVKNEFCCIADIQLPMRRGWVKREAKSRHHLRKLQESAWVSGSPILSRTSGSQRQLPGLYRIESFLEGQIQALVMELLKGVQSDLRSENEESFG